MMCSPLQTATLDAGLMTIDNLNINGTRTLVANGTTTLSNISTLIDNAFSNFSKWILCFNMQQTLIIFMQAFQA